MPQRVVHRQIFVLTTLLALVLGVLATLSPPGRADEVGSGTLTGYVRGTDGRRMADVMVEVFAVGVDEPPVATVDVEGAEGDLGSYRVDVPAGDYRLRFSGAGLTSRWYGIGAGETVTVAATETTSLRPTTVSPASQSVIYGFITARGVLTDDVKVQALDASGDVVASAITYEGGSQDHGYFALYLPAGTYTLRYEPAEESDVAYLPGVVDVPINVMPGDSADAGTLALVEAGQMRVTGRIEDAAGTPEGGTRTTVYARLGQHLWSRRTRSNQQGTYSVTGVPRGALVQVCVRRSSLRTCLNGHKRFGPDGVRLPSDQEESQLPDLVRDVVLVNGSVVDPFTDDVQGLRVAYYRLGDRQEPVRFRLDRTRSDGSFRRAFGANGRTLTACVEGLATPVCLGGASDPAAADTFTLPSSTGIVDLDPMVVDSTCDSDCQDSDRVRVSALATTLAGQPLAGSILQAFQWQEGQWSDVDASVGGAQGRVRSFLPPGTYTFRVLRAGLQPVFLGGGSELPDAPSDSNSVVVVDAPIDLGTFALPRLVTTFGTPVAGEYGADSDYCLSRVLERNDDLSSAAVPVPFEMRFFGQPASRLFVNNNGNITFGNSLSSYTPAAFGLDGSYNGPPIIAPFFADVDTTNQLSNVVTFGSNAAGTKFCVNWTDVGYYASRADKLNSFQLILTKASGDARAAGDFDIQFNYDQILWETGDASDGVDGFDGTSALAGFTAGTPEIPGTVVQLPGSLVNGALLDSGDNALVHGTLNAGGRPGRYNFSVNNAGVQQRLGSLGGTVVTTDGEDPDTDPDGVEGALVEPCREVAGQLRCYGSARTDSEGGYAFVGLPGGVAEEGEEPFTAEPIVYTLRVSPPAGSPFFPAVGSGGVRAGLDNSAEQILLTGPRPVPETGVTIETAPDTPVEGFAPYVRDDGILQMYWRTALALSVQGCPGQASPMYTFTVGGTTVDSGPMVEEPGTPLSTYTAVVQRPYPLAGDGSLTTTVVPSCAPDSVPVAFDVYIDPSGTVTDQFGIALDGVTATLMRSDTVGGPFAAVPQGSAIMSPANRNNPDVLESDGAFAWFVQSGVYRVDAARNGCTSTSTDELQVPPERLALLIKMQCPARSVLAATQPTLSAATARQGTSLTVTPATWPAPLQPTRIEWRRGGTVVGTQATYTPTAADAGQQLTVRTYGQRPQYRQENRDDGALVTFDESYASVQTAVVEALPGGGGGGGGLTTINNTAKPTISGSAKVDGILTASPGTWDTDGVTFAYQWLLDGVAITGATSGTYSPVAGDLGKAVSVKVTASKSGSTSGTSTSDAVTIAKGVAAQNVTKPFVTGEAEVGKMLTVSDGTWDLQGLTFGYQWLRDGTAIGGATSATYVVTEADRGSELSARVTAAKTAHEDGSATASGVTVPEAPDEVTPAPSTTKAMILGNKIGRGERGEVRVKVTSEGDSVPTGTVTVTAGDKSVEVELEEADGGRVKVTLPKLKPGTYPVTVDYSGDDLTEPSSDDAGTIKVKEKKDGKGKGKKGGKGKRASSTRIGGPLLAA